MDLFEAVHAKLEEARGRGGEGAAGSAPTEAMIYVGIDPGLDGGLARIYPNGFVHLEVMPTLDGVRRGGTGRSLDLVALARDIGELLDINRGLYAVLEEQVGMPSRRMRRKPDGSREVEVVRMPAASAFTVGQNYGAILGVLTALDVPFEIVRPQVWQREFGISRARGDTKAQAAQVATRLFPEVDLRVSERGRVPHSGKCDALLIMEFARRKHTGRLAA